MAYARNIVFANNTVLVAGTGDDAPRVGINDEVQAAWNEATARQVAHFSDGSIGLGQMAAPRHSYSVTYGKEGLYRPWENLNIYPGLGTPISPVRILAHFSRGSAYRLDRIVVGLRGWEWSEVGDHNGSVGGVEIRFRFNGRTGDPVCKTLRLSDFPIESATRDVDRYVFQFGGEDGDAPLFLTDFAANDSIYVSALWSDLNPAMSLGQSLALRSPGVTLYVSEEHKV